VDDETRFDVGDAPTLFYDVSSGGVPVDPATVTLTIEPPEGAPVSFSGGELDNPELGRFERVFELTLPGTYAIRWHTTNPKTAHSTAIFVRRSEVLTELDPRALVSLEKLKRWLTIPAGFTDEDDILVDAINGASDTLYEETGREFKTRLTGPQPRTFRDAWGGLVVVTGVWGWPAVPHEIEEAAKVMAAITYSRDVRRFSQTFVVEEGRVDVPRAVPSTIWDKLEHYRRGEHVAAAGRRITPGVRHERYVNVGDLADLDAVTLNGATLELGGIVAWPEDRDPAVKPIRRLYLGWGP
jgi:hypothetical protein